MEKLPCLTEGLPVRRLVCCRIWQGIWLVWIRWNWSCLADIISKMFLGQEWRTDCFWRNQCFWYCIMGYKGKSIWRTSLWAFRRKTSGFFARLCESLQNGWSGDRHPARKPDDYAKEAKIAVDKGFDAIKMNFSTWRRQRRESQQPVRPWSRCRYYFGKPLLYRCTAAVQFGNIAKKYGILYFEELTAPHPDLLSYVHRQTGIPVASGERIYSRWQFQKHL